MNHAWAATRWHNWAGNVTDAASFSAPTSVNELADTVRRAAAKGRRVRPAGSGHSFSPVAMTDGIRISLTSLPDVITVDGTSATVPGGITLRALNRALAAHGLALPNLGDIDAQTIAGALQTGTHGTGSGYGCLPSFLSAMTLVTADGRVRTCSRTDSPEIFFAAAVGLGALGVLTSVTLDCVPAFVLRAVERPASLDEVLSSIDSLVCENEHVEFFWFPYTERVQLKRSNRVTMSDAPLSRWRRWLDDELLSNAVFGAGCRIARLTPAFARSLMRVSARALAPREYTAVSHEVFCTPRRVRFLEMEYALPRSALRPAFDGIRSIVDSIRAPIAFPVEVRFTAADDLWLSHGYGRDSVYLAVHQYLGLPFESYFGTVEDLCLGLGGRPHWGKVHFASPETLRSAYPRFVDWAAVRRQLDPGGVFGSPFLDNLLA